MSRSDATVGDEGTSSGANNTNENTDADRDLRATVGRALSEAALLAAVVVWTAFWLVVARIHVLRGHPVDAFATAAMTALPAVALYSWRWVGRLADVAGPGAVSPSPLGS